MMAQAHKRREMRETMEERSVETKVEALSESQIKVTITVEAEEVARRFKKEYKNCAHRYQFPGFRKGKAPRPVIDSALGEDFVAAMVTDNLTNEMYPKAFDLEHIQPIGKPDFGEPDLAKEGEDYSFDFTIDVVPDAQLSSYEPVEIELPNVAASEEEVEEQISMLQDHYFHYDDAAEDAVITADSRVELDIKAVDDEGTQIDSVTTDDFPYTLGSDMMPEAFDAELIGMKAGEKKNFTIDLPETPTAYMYDVNGGGTATFDVEVKSIKLKVIPEITDEWAQDTLGFEDVADLRTRIAESIEQEKGEMIPRMREIQSLKQLVERVQAEVPEAMINDTETRLLQDFFKQLQQHGITLDTYLMQNDLTAEQFRDDIKQQATDMAKEDMALDSWAKHFEIEATDEELMKVFEDAGAEDPQALYNEWLESGRMYIVRSGVLREKALDNVMDTAIVSEFEIKLGEGAAEEAEAQEAAEEAEVVEEA